MYDPPRKDMGFYAWPWFRTPPPKKELCEDPPPKNEHLSEGSKRPINTVFGVFREGNFRGGPLC